MLSPLSFSVNASHPRLASSTDPNKLAHFILSNGSTTLSPPLKLARLVIQNNLTAETLLDSPSGVLIKFAPEDPRISNDLINIKSCILPDEVRRNQPPQPSIQDIARKLAFISPHLDSSNEYPSDDSFDTESISEWDFDTNEEEDSEDHAVDVEASLTTTSSRVEALTGSERGDELLYNSVENDSSCSVFSPTLPTCESFPLFFAYLLGHLNAISQMTIALPRDTHCPTCSCRRDTTPTTRHEQFDVDPTVLNEPPLSYAVPTSGPSDERDAAHHVNTNTELSFLTMDDPDLFAGCSAWQDVLTDDVDSHPTQDQVCIHMEAQCSIPSEGSTLLMLEDTDQESAGQVQDDVGSTVGEDVAETGPFHDKLVLTPAATSASMTTNVDSHLSKEQNQQTTSECADEREDHDDSESQSDDGGDGDESEGNANEKIGDKKSNESQRKTKKKRTGSKKGNKGGARKGRKG